MATQRQQQWHPSLNKNGDASANKNSDASANNRMKTMATQVKTTLATQQLRKQQNNKPRQQTADA